VQTSAYPARTQVTMVIAAVQSQRSGSPVLKAVMNAAMIDPSDPASRVRGSLNSDPTIETYISRGSFCH
jgi:hypothetical protein